jgi:hypothetical protein
MNTENRFVVLFSMAVVLVLLAACGAPQPTATTVPAPAPPATPMARPATPTVKPAGITVTFEGDECVYHGPGRVPAGRVQMVLDVKDQTAHDLYEVGVLTVDEGKTLEDIIAWPASANMPVWGHDHGSVEAAQGTAQETTIVLFEGPIFLVCFAGPSSGKGGKVDVLGPIEIEPQAPSTITSAKELAGVWHRTTLTDFGSEVYRQYTEDGIYRMGNSLEELESEPRVEGRFWFEGGQILIQDTSGLSSFDGCVQGQETGPYDVELLETGHIRFVPIEDECTERRTLLGSGEMERVS